MQRYDTDLSGRNQRTRRDRRRPVLIAMAVLLLGGILATLPLTASTAATTTPAVSAATDPANGFPLWYQDSTGTRLSPCLDPADANCIVTADAGYDPTKPQVFPTNFPGEFFYANTQSDRLATPGCKGAKPGRISLLDSLEGAFVNGAPKFGDQMVFGRERLIVTGGLCPKATYQVNGPYGHFSFVTDNNGALAKNQGTTDIGCAPLAPNVCDFSIALTSPQAKSFLRWDPAVAPQAPSGYLGDATTLHRIVGGTNGNAFTVTGPGANGNLTLTTSLFTVMGKLAGPLSATPNTVNFGGVPAGTVSAPKSVTVTTLAPTAVTPGTATITGPNAADFAVSSDGCATQVIATDATCQISVTFSPAAAASGPRSATLVVPHNSFGQSLSVPLSGTSTAATEAPAISVSPSSIDFGQVRKTFGRADQDITVTNNGTAPLAISDVSLNGGDASDFSVINHCADPVAPNGGTCLVNVAFAPTVDAARSTTLQITSNATPAITSVPLSGTGIGGHAAVSSTNTLTFPDWYQDEAGVRLDQCLDPNDPECLVLPGGTFDGTNTDLSFPDNFPDEFFWYDADADVLSTPGCNGTAPGKLRFRFAMEGAFLNGDPAVGDQMTFGRLRVQGSGGLCPTHDYTAVTPYGSWKVTTDDLGGLKPGLNTTDVGCTPAPGVPCDYSLALHSDVLGGFLRWDPSQLPKAPAGYLGDPNVLHTVVGAPYQRNGQPVNYVALYDGAVDPANLVVRTDKFNVMGKLGGPLVAEPSSADFPDPMPVGSAPATRTITLSNQGIDPITVNGFSVSGDAAGSFSAGPNTCQAALAPGGTCTVTVSFSPVDVGPQKAALVVDHTGLNSPLSVPLSGVGTPSEGTAALSVDRSSVSFAQLHTGRTSPAQQLAVSNIGGTAALSLGNLDITGPGAASFTVSRGDCPDSIDIGATCHLEVRFAPSAAGDLSATLTVNALPPSSPSFRNVTLSGTGFAGDAAVSSSIDQGFPAYYQDANGVRVAPCTNPNDGACAMAPDPNLDTSQPVSFPGNFPGEFFYTVANSEPLSITDTCADGSTAQADVSLLEGVEGAFVTDAPEAGQQITFARSRIILGPRATTLCPTTAYTFVTPYGPQTFTTDATGALKRTDGTVSVGCAGPAAGTTTPACDYAEALGGDQFGGFLRWAPGVGIAPPAGYLGDGVTFHQVVGATYVAPGETEPANYFEVQQAGTSLGRTAKFSVVGKLASGLSAPAPADFGDVTTNAFATKTLTFSNIGTTAVQVASAQVGNGPFSVIGGTCVGSVPARSDCTLQVKFAPTTAGPASATASLLAADGSTLASVAVTGNGLAPTGPQIAASPASLTFPAAEVGTSSAAQQVTVRNTGGSGLNVQAATLSGAGAADYAVTVPASCQAMAANATCQLGVVFTPRASGSRAAVLTIASNAPGAAPTVALTGTGQAAQIQLKDPTFDLGTQAIGRTVTKPFVVTNSGSAPLRLTALTLSSTVDFTATLGTCTAAVAPGKNCQINITFTAKAPAGAKRANLTFTSNAVNSPSTPVTGTSK
jgi:hypothetical protein